MAIRVLIVDDHAVVRQGLRMFLSLDSELEIVGEGANGHEALALARRLKPDVVLMDLLMPAMDGMTATKTICRELPEVQVIALTSVLTEASEADAIAAGAAAYLLKDAAVDRLSRAIKDAAAGPGFLRRQLLDSPRT